MSSEQLLTAVKEVLGGRGLNETAKTYGINKAILSGAIKGYQLKWLTTSLNKDLSGLSYPLFALTFCVGYILGFAVLLFILYLKGRI